MAINSEPIIPPVAPVSGFSVQYGAPIPKLARLRIMSDTDWEELVQEWATAGLKPLHGYSQVHRCGGAGDKGRDVIAYVGETTGIYDNFQCKHYDYALHPGDAWLEIGKLCYYTFMGEYGVPRKYKFVAPLGVGTTLLRLLESLTNSRRHSLRNGMQSVQVPSLGRQQLHLPPNCELTSTLLTFRFLELCLQRSWLKSTAERPFT